MVPLILGVLVVAIVVAGVFLLRGDRDDIVDERLDQLGEYTSEYLTTADADDTGERASASDFVAQQLERAVAGRGFAEGMKKTISIWKTPTLNIPST